MWTSHPHPVFLIVVVVVVVDFNFNLLHPQLSTSRSTWLVSGASNRGGSLKRDVELFAVTNGGQEKLLQNEEFQVEEDKEQIVEIMADLQRQAESKFGVRLRKSGAPVGELFEGDIALTLEQAKMLSESLKRRKKRKLTEPQTRLWTLPIPYAFDGSHDDSEKRRIREAMKYWESKTCISFAEDEDASHKLIFAKQKGCWSYVGFTEQKNQTISVGDGCQSNGTIAHELGHAIGFWHEQSRPDRDLFVSIIEENVADNKLYNFITRSWGEVMTYDVPYDLGSDMHYGAKFYARDVNATLTTVQTRDPLMEKVIGQRQELSFYDVKLANIAYCSDVCTDSLPQPCRRDGYQDPKNCKSCRCPEGFGGNFCESVQPSDNAICGGVLDASHGGVIYSPGYTSPGYQADVKCSWLIKAPDHYNVHLEFVDNFGITCHQDVCRDFVEVRYNTSLSLTGARFCCSEKPQTIIKSKANEMLVLFRTFSDSGKCNDVNYPWKCIASNIGFKARFHAKHCGGFSNLEASSSSSSPSSSSSSSVEAACWRRLSFLCAQSWEEKSSIDCPKWWQAKSCGSRTINKLRRSTCYRDQAYCASGLQLNRSSSTCSAKTSNVVSKELNNNNSNNNSDPKLKSNPRPSGKKNNNNNNSDAWSRWSSWGNCSRMCGGGRRLRTRNCTDTSVCSTKVVYTSRQHCDQPPCLTKCTTNASFVFHCNVKSLCSKKECSSYCNHGFELIGDVCSKKSQ